MCKEDERLNQKRLSAATVVTTDIAAVKVVAVAAKDRTSITFYTGEPSGTAIVSPDKIDPLTQGGMFVGTTNPPLTLTTKTHGDIVRQAWNAVGVTAAIPLLVIESFLPESTYEK